VQCPQEGTHVNMDGEVLHFYMWPRALLEKLKCFNFR